MTTKELINQYVTVHADNRWMDASELEALLTEFAEEMKKDAIEGKVVAVRTTMSDRLHTYPWIELETQLSKNDKVKVIIIKE